MRTTSLLSSVLFSAAACLALAGCQAATPVLLLDGTSVEHVDTSATLGAPPTGSGLRVQLNVTDRGPPNVADAGASYQFQIDLAAGLQAGTTLDVDGIASFDGVDTGGADLTRTFAPGAGNAELVQAVSLAVRCFCGLGIPSHFEQSITGHIDVVAVSGLDVTVEVDLVVDGAVPGLLGSHRLHLMGHFHATQPTR